MKKLFLGTELDGEITQIKKYDEGLLNLNKKGFWLVKGINQLLPNRTDLVKCHGQGSNHNWCTTVHEDIENNPMRCTVNGITPYSL